MGSANRAAFIRIPGKETVLGYSSLLLLSLSHRLFDK